MNALPKKLIVVRHGESLRNLAKQTTYYFGSQDEVGDMRGIPDFKIPLTDRGVEQSVSLGKILASEFFFDAIFHSGYIRTEQTIEGILSSFSHDEKDRLRKVTSFDSFLRERDAGYTYEMTAEDVERYFPYMDAHWKTFGSYFTRPPGGESLNDVANRVHAFIQTTLSNYSDQTVLVVAHGGTLRAFYALFERLSYDEVASWPKDLKAGNGEGMIFENDGQNLRFTEFLRLPELDQ